MEGSETGKEGQVNGPAEWNYQRMTGENALAPDNPSGHPMIVPQSTPTRQPVELPVGRPAMVPRAELEAVERERDEAVSAWKRVSLEAEHWLSLASKRKDELEEVRQDLVKQLDSGAKTSLRNRDLSAKLDDARKQLDRLAAFAEELLENTVVPERACSCHISPPCNDCVEFGGLREIVDGLKDAIAAVKGGQS